MAGTLKDAISEYLSNHPYIKHGLKEDIINFSALARQMAPEIEKATGKKINSDSVMVAIRRYTENGIIPVKSSNLRETLKKSLLVMQNGMSFAILENEPDASSQVYSMMQNNKWSSTEFRIIIGSPSYKVVIVRKNRMDEIIASLPPGQVREREDGFIIITLRPPIETFKEDELASELTGELAKSGLAAMVLAAPPEMHFVTKEANGQKAYAALKNYIGNGHKPE